jgi:hypothetical protein
MVPAAPLLVAVTRPRAAPLQRDEMRLRALAQVRKMSLLRMIECSQAELPRIEERLVAQGYRCVSAAVPERLKPGEYLKVSYRGHRRRSGGSSRLWAVWWRSLTPGGR